MREISVAVREDDGIDTKLGRLPFTAPPPDWEEWGSGQPGVLVVDGQLSAPGTGTFDFKAAFFEGRSSLLVKHDDLHVFTAFFTWPEVGVPPCFGFRLADGRFVYMYLLVGD